MADAGGSDRLYSADQLHQFSSEILEKSGMRAADAALIAEHYVWAELRNLSWFGVGRIPQHTGRLRAGGTAADAEAVTLVDTPSLAVVDACNGYSWVCAARLMKSLAEKARSSGVAIGTIRNTSSAGALGFYASLAAEAGMIGMVINNSVPLIAAPGGGSKLVGNQAFAIAAPAGRNPPMVLDTAISVMSMVRIHDFEVLGEPLPEGVALDEAGRPTVDPAAAAILQAIGGHRGFGLALMWEILTGVLAGGETFGRDVGAPYDLDKAQGVSMFLMAIDPSRIMPFAEFQARVDRVIDDVHASPPGPSGERILVPGERSQALAARRKVEGIPIPLSLVAKLNEIGKELGVPALPA